jgi:IS5 family transposase
MADHLQLGFTDYEQTYASKRMLRQRFLDEMEVTVPWEDFLALIQPAITCRPAKGVVRL